MRHILSAWRRIIRILRPRETEAIVMGNSLVVLRGTGLAKRAPALRAAQYVRMSTDMQRYSIQNQAAAIAAYAQDRNITIGRRWRQ
ncbi:recombinase family protein [Bradyrhizobium sp. SHOUNA76]|uniref:recombinase family protein n=1 Tax=Bradyrhizobium sp. SHOUNA76 TaxID=2908927 RepID=UPI003857CBE7